MGTKLLPKHSAILVSAVAGTADIAGALSLALERMLDGRSNGGMAQADVERYYDNINVPKCCLWLRNRGVPPPLCAAILRVQLLVPVHIRAANACAKIQCRCSGALTGTRVAGALGRIPTVATAIKRLHAWHRWLWEGPLRMGIAVYVDNIFAVGSSPGAACAILDDMGQHLAKDWGLRWKPSSRSALVPAGGRNDVDQQNWPIEQVWFVLGFKLHCGGNAEHCVDAATGAVWRSFYANAASRAGKNASFNNKLKLLETATSPQIIWRSICWPCSRKLITRLNQLQTKVLAVLHPVRKFPGEPIDEYWKKASQPHEQAHTC